MLLILRKAKRNFFANKQFHNYILYALGEMVLVVVGILIALQIDNWNNENRQQESLESYLNSIARNMGRDLVAVEAIRTRREAAYELSLRVQSFVTSKAFFHVDEIAFANHALIQAQEIDYFIASISGYEALMSSGNLDQLQGRDIEKLLYDYYDTVGRIEHIEQNQNDYVKQLSLQAATDWPKNFHPVDFSDPGILNAERFQMLQPVYRALLGNNNTNALYDRARSVGPLIMEYERLGLLGGAFIRMIENGTTEFDEITVTDLDGIYNPGSGSGYSKVIADGQVSWHSYDVDIADSFEIQNRGYSLDPAAGHQNAFHLRSIEQLDNSLHIAYPGGAEWAVISISVQGSSTTRPSLDFSGFDKLLLEIKGDLGGEQILVNIKDRDDPDDGKQANIELTLTNEWRTYEVDLARFNTADLTNLHVVMAFLFYEEAQSFSVKTVQYLGSN